MIHLRKLEPTDLPFLYQWENDDTAWKDGDTHNPLSQQDLRAYIDATTGDIYKDGQLRLIIEHDGAAVGCVDLYDFDPTNRKAAIGVYVASDFRNQGLAQEAICLLEDYATKHLNMRLLYAYVATDNIPGSRLFEQAHYQPSSPLKAWLLQSDAILWHKPLNDII